MENLKLALENLQLREKELTKARICYEAAQRDYDKALIQNLPEGFNITEKFESGSSYSYLQLRYNGNVIDHSDNMLELAKKAVKHHNLFSIAGFIS